MASLHIFRHALDADRPPHGFPPMAPVVNVAWRPHARFGAATRGSRSTRSSTYGLCGRARAGATPFRRIALHKELSVPMRASSAAAPYPVWPAARSVWRESRALHYTHLHGVWPFARPSDVSFLLHAHIPLHIHAHVHAYIHAYVHTYTYEQNLCRSGGAPGTGLGCGPEASRRCI